MTRSTRIVSGLTALILAASLSGCATSSSPPAASVYTYPAQGQSAQQQAQDTSECQTWAIGAATGSAGTGAAIGAAAGGIGGAAYGGTSQYGKGENGYNQAYSACMTGRGYSTGK